MIANLCASIVLVLGLHHRADCKTDQPPLSKSLVYTTRLSVVVYGVTIPFISFISVFPSHTLRHTCIQLAVGDHAEMEKKDV